MKQWKWQKAILKIKDDTFPQMYNKEVWVEVGKPQIIEGITIDGKCLYVEGFLTNLKTWEDDESIVPVDRKRVEWLARGPKDFADEIALVPYEEWSKWK